MYISTLDPKDKVSFDIKDSYREYWRLEIKYGGCELAEDKDMGYNVKFNCKMIKLLYGNENEESSYSIDFDVLHYTYMAEVVELPPINDIIMAMMERMNGLALTTLNILSSKKKTKNRH